MGVTLVGLDPSMTLAFRGEYKALVGAAFRATVELPQEWLARVLARANMKPTVESPNVTLFLHCTERTNAAASASQWKSVFDRLGIELALANTGCCGMAGTFGHETGNRTVSEQLYAMSWKPVVDKAKRGDILMATGYSCRSQVKTIDSFGLLHPIQVIERLLPTVPASEAYLRGPPRLCGSAPILLTC